MIVKHYALVSRLVIGLAVAFVFFASAAGTFAAPAGEPVVPPDSRLGRADLALQRVLLSPLEGDSPVRKGGWNLTALAAGQAPAGVMPKVGRTALRLAGEAKTPGAKGDFSVSGAVYGQSRMLGLWFHLEPGANVSSVGLQVHDAEGESLMATAPADWQGWRWAEFELAGSAFQPSYDQKKNAKVDLPLQGVQVVWFAKTAGPTSVTADGLVAATEASQGAAGGAAHVAVDVLGGGVSEPGQPLPTQLVLTNFSDKPAATTVEFTVQSDPALFSSPPPDPDHGTDHAVGTKSWTEADGRIIEEGSLTDGKEFTTAGTEWRNNHWAEAFQFVDLGRELKVSHMAYTSGDANWTWKVDVAASTDGKTYAPVASLQGVDLHKKWGRQPLKVPAPFTARYLRLRYHNEGQKTPVIRMPATLSVYDGPGEEAWQVPSVGTVIAKGSRSAETPARSFSFVNIGDATPLPTGAYLVVAKVTTGGRTELIYRHHMVMPARLDRISPDSRFGLNASDPSLAPLAGRLGVGWVRFENMKWPMVSPGPGVYRYDGSVPPWHVNHDAIVAAYAAEGISVLPFLFQTAPYASSAPPSLPAARRMSHPPKDPNTFAEFCFQTAARYGGAKHPAEALKTSDKQSGKGSVSTYEIWNEPNLTAPSWGPWVGTSEQYMELFRPAAEAVKRADPSAKVTNGGYAGIEVETIDALRTHRYADGKRPLDFVDVLNVHYYSGRVPPEIAKIDTNVRRDGGAKEAREALTYEEHLRRLAAWRTEHKPGLPIWLTETGYDTDGPHGVSEQLQAARLPRVVMLALAAGVEKVFVYREKGSSPSLHAASGLLREDGSFKPSWFTYAMLIRALHGATDIRRLPHPDPNARLYAWTRGGEVVLSAWAVEGSATLGLDIGKCTATDAFGGRREVDLAKDKPLALSEFPVYLSGMSNAASVKRLTEAKVDENIPGH